MTKCFFTAREIHLKWIACLFFVAAFGLKASSQTHTPITVGISSRIGGYWEYLPADYSTSGKKYPLILFFHGSGEVGSGSQQDLLKVLKWGPPKQIANGTWPKTFTVNGQSFTPIVISPQYLNTSRSLDDYKALIAYVLKKYRIDESRIYMTGLSHGGGTAIYYPSLSDGVANQVAAIVTAAESVYSNAAGIARFAKYKMPLWMCSNSDDPTVPIRYSQSWYDGLSAYTPKYSPQPIFDIFNASGHDSWSKMYDLNYKPRGLNVYEWMFQYTRGTSTNNVDSSVSPKIVMPSSVVLPTSSVTMDGSQSSTAVGAIKSYLWKCISGPSGYIIANDTASKSTLSNLAVGSYQVQLSVTNTVGKTASVNATIQVIANKLPVASMQDIANVTLPKDSVVLDGSASYDPDGTIQLYKWSKISGPTGYSLSSSSAPIATLHNLVEGTYEFKLEVQDNNGGTNTIAKSFVVYPSAPPVAIVTGPSSIDVDSVTLDGTTSRAASGRVIAKYLWTKISGPQGDSVNNINQPKISIFKLLDGTYVYQLMVTDNIGATNADSITYTVANSKKTVNKQPVAVFNNIASIVLPKDSVILDGSASYDPDGTIQSYNWSLVSGPIGYSLSNSTASIAQLHGLTKGTYRFMLRVKDNNGATDTLAKSFTVYVSPPLVAIINCPSSTNVDSITLDGSASHAASGRKIVKYAWTKISGPQGDSVTGKNQPTICIRQLQSGKYVYQLVVTDDRGSSYSAIAQFGVEINKPPVALIKDIPSITLPLNQVTLDGTLSLDSDGIIKSYTWAYVDGPSAYTLINSSTSVAIAKDLVAGTYSFMLTVRDDKGDSNSLIKSFIVNMSTAPVAIIKGPSAINTTSVTLDGSASYASAGRKIAKYAWLQLSGPKGFTVNSTRQATITATNLKPGDYLSQLTVTDDKGNTNSTTTTFKVYDTTNTTGANSLSLLNTKIAATSETNARLLASSTSGSVVVMKQPANTTNTINERKDSFQPKVISNNNSNVSDQIPGAKESANNSLKLYPVPALDYLNFKLNNNVLGRVAIRINDISGRALIVKNSIAKESFLWQDRVDVTKLGAGIYFAEVFIGGQKFSGKFLKVLK